MVISELDQEVDGPRDSFERFDPVILATAERRVFLAAALRLYLRRLSRGIQVTQTDLYRVARYGDDPGVAA
jgi:hypothetical protein